MAESYYSILTNIGKAQIANAIGLGNKIDFVKMKVGDGNGSYYNPTESQTDLVHTVWEGAIGHVAVDENNPNWINIEVLIPPDAGGFFIREYGVFDANDNMLAVAKCAETYKPLPADGSTKEINMKMIIAVSNTSSITLKIDPTILFAKKKDVDEVSTRVDQLSVSINNINTQLSDLTYQVAGGTAAALTLTIKGTLVTGYPITFIASANNGGSATTINGKKLYKPNTTTSPNLISGKAYTVWYNSTGDCFFIKASATGNTIPSHVLAGDTFSTDIDIDLIGTMPNNGALNYNMPINGSFSIPLGYTIGGAITQNITTKSAQTYQPSTTTQTITSGQYLSGNQTIAPVTGNATINDVISGKVFSSANGINLTGQATIESLGGRKVASGTSALTYIAGAYGVTISSLALSFTPSIIVAKSNLGNYYAVWNSTLGFNLYCGSANVTGADSLVSPFSSTSFIIIASTISGVSNISSSSCTWYAWE